MSRSFGQRYFRTRKAVQVAMAAFWLALPLSGFLQVDIAHVRLLLGGRPWPPLTPDMLPASALKRGAAPHWEIIAPALLQTVLPVVMLAIAFVLTARYFGRVHCGFTCFYGFMAETGESLWRWARKPGPDKPLRLALFGLVVTLFAPFMAFTILSIFATPTGVARGLAGLALTQGLMALWVEVLHMTPGLAKIPTAGIVFIFNFAVRRALLFRAPRVDAARP